MSNQFDFDYEDEIFLSKSEREQRESEKRSRDEFLQDLKVVLQSQEGYRILKAILVQCGVERQVSESSMELRNFGERLLDDIQTASFNSCIRLISDIRMYNK